MILVLPDALPPVSIAAELARRLAAVAPTFCAWLEHSPARVQHTPAAEFACTPLQAWQLGQAGYGPPPDTPLGAGWPVLAHPDMAWKPDEPVWIANLVHLHVTHHGVMLTDPAALALTPEDAEALMASARPLLEELDIGVRQLDARDWQLTLPEGVTPYAPTPAAAVGDEIQGGWSQSPANRPWRRALNMVQMAWHDHHVNERRTAHGQPAVNGLWLYGGGRASDFSPSGSPPAAPQINLSLAAPAQRSDWAAWLDAWAQLEASLFHELDQTVVRRSRQSLSLVLTGDTRLATLDIRTPTGLARWLPRRRHDWRTWWNASV